MSTTVVSRILEGLPHTNTIVLPKLRIRFQIAAGDGANIGIAGVKYQILFSGVPMSEGVTDPNGEIIVPLVQARAGNCSIKIFDTEYPVQITPNWEAVDTYQGMRQRLDHLGYMHGHLMDATIDPAADGNINERTLHAVNDFLWDSDLPVDGEVTSAMRTKLTSSAGV